MALATVSQTVTPNQAEAIVLSFFTVILPEKNSLWHSDRFHHPASRLIA
ncbi:MAG: hypothetical protein V7K21_12010 [Nostoc sp.]